MLKSERRKEPISPYKRQDILTAITFLLPNFLGFVCFTLFPLAFGFVLLFLQWDVVTPPRFIGLQNLKEMFTADPLSWLVAKNSMIFAFGAVPLTLICSLALALLVNRAIRGIAILRTIFFAPVVTSSVAAAIVWKMAYNPDYGFINGFLVRLGISDPPRWLASTIWALPAVILVYAWKNMGYYMVLLLAGLQGIPQHLYEVADLDGATNWHKFRYVTLPLLSPTLFFVMIMLVNSSFQSLDLVYVMTKGGPVNATNVIVMYIYQQAFQFFRMGYAASLSWVLFAVIFGFTILQFALQKRWVFYG